MPAKIHKGLVDLFLLLVFVQFYLAGLGVFRAKSHGHQHLLDSSTFDPHRGLGTFLQIVALIILIVAAVGRTQVRESAALFVLMVLQSVWAGIGASAPAVAAIHVVAGLLILGLTFTMHRAGRRAQPAPAG